MLVLVTRGRHRVHSAVDLHLLQADLLIDVCADYTEDLVPCATSGDSPRRSSMLCVESDLVRVLTNSGPGHPVVRTLKLPIAKVLVVLVVTVSQAVPGGNNPSGRSKVNRGPVVLVVGCGAARGWIVEGVTLEQRRTDPGGLVCNALSAQVAESEGQCAFACPQPVNQTTRIEVVLEARKQRGWNRASLFEAVQLYPTDCQALSARVPPEVTVAVLIAGGIEPGKEAGRCVSAMDRSVPRLGVNDRPADAIIGTLEVPGTKLISGCQVRAMAKGVTAGAHSTTCPHVDLKPASRARPCILAVALPDSGLSVHKVRRVALVALCLRGKAHRNSRVGDTLRRKGHSVVQGTEVIQNAVFIKVLLVVVCLWSLIVLGSVELEAAEPKVSSGPDPEKPHVVVVWGAGVHCEGGCGLAVAESSARRPLVDGDEGEKVGACLQIPVSEAGTIRGIPVLESVAGYVESSVGRQSNLPPPFNVYALEGHPPLQRNIGVCVGQYFCRGHDVVKVPGAVVLACLLLVHPSFIKIPRSIEIAGVAI
mmetsp:Transcript_1871/g.4219  ORF Transcript_1871/g.4219 Transcript_1871/m.4219 type:complete len:535 (+) Transcript_1871:1214-2818(+)